MNPTDTLRAALDAAPAPMTFFLRDDDGGWDDARLFALLDCTEHAGVPIDVAMIPCATNAALAVSLGARINAAPRLVGVHQHGFAHTNHETVQRKCEFGAARSLPAQRDDLVAGRERLRELVGARLDPIFTPPWNRCSTGTPALLAELGYAALSRDRGASAQGALPELAVDLDWCRQRRLAASAGDDFGERIARELARCIGQQQPTLGVMLHHADMEDGELVLLSALLAAVRAHPRARWRPMRELIDVSAPRPPAL
jgi:predicted deacetylase